MINGTAPWVWVILTPSSGTSGIGIMPFRDLTAVPRGPSGTAVAQVGGNVLVFAALGALPPMRSAELAGLAAIAAVTATGSAGVEALQYMPHLGRVSAIDDTLLDATGAIPAAMVSRRWWAHRIAVGDVR
jgi:VanZ like family.